MHSRRRYQYDNRIGLLGLALGVAILAIGFLTHHGEQAFGIAMAVLFLSIGAAYRRVDEYRAGHIASLAGCRRRRRRASRGAAGRLGAACGASPRFAL